MIRKKLDRGEEKKGTICVQMPSGFLSSLEDEGTLAPDAFNQQSAVTSIGRQPALGL